jgi:DNA-binding transcriptional regulator LsrR (DeoR family)
MAKYIGFDTSCPTNSRLLELYRGGVPISEIGVALGLSVHAVRSRVWSARKKGLIQGSRYLRASDPIQDEILALYNDGITYDEIAARLCASRTFVCGRIRMLRKQGKISGERSRGLKKGYKFSDFSFRFDERLERELSEQYRREFLQKQSATTWTQRSDYQP